MKPLTPYRLLVPLVVAVSSLAPTSNAFAVGWDDDDFIIAGFSSDTIGVYDSDFTFKGNLATSFERVIGLDFDALGNLVAVKQSNLRGGGPAEVRVYNNIGTQLAPLSFINSDLGASIDLKVGPAELGGNYYVGTQDYFGGNGLIEFTRAGITGQTFDTGDYEGVAVLPGNVLWGSSEAIGGIEVFDLVTGNNIATLPFDNGQLGASSMFYSAATDTVLIADTSAEAIFERRTDGAFVRSFNAAGFGRTFGVVRGPGGDVFADGDDDGVFHWRADGTFVGFIDLSASILNPSNIVWTGNIVPEPASLTLLGLGGLGVLLRRRQQTSRGQAP